MSNHQTSEILIIDDNDVTNQLMVEFLADYGYRVNCAQNGLQGLDYLKDHNPPDLILLDLLMPAMNGWQFLTIIKHQPQLQSIPILVVSGNQQDQQRAIEMGAVGFFPKPIEIDQLLIAIRLHTKPIGKTSQPENVVAD